MLRIPYAPGGALTIALMLSACAGSGARGDAAAAPRADGAPDRAVATAPAATLYQRLGGAAGVDAFVDALLRRALADPAVAPDFADVDLPYFRARLVEQVCEITGGGCTYTGLAMEDAHSGLAITDAEFDHFAGMAEAALGEVGAPNDATAEVMTALAGMRAQIVGQ